VSERSISYTPDFKITAVKENLNGKGPAQIFIEHGFDLKVIGPDKPKQCLKRWRKTFNELSEEGFLTERRGKGSTGMPSSKQLSAEDSLKKAEARIKYIKVAYNLSKKLKMDLVYDTLKKLSESPNGMGHLEAILRSRLSLHAP
jgi:transposase